MHDTYYVAVEANSAEEAKAKAEQVLFQEDFLFHEGFFCGGRADSFVVIGAHKHTADSLGDLRLESGEHQVFLPHQSEEKCLEDLAFDEVAGLHLVEIDYHY